MLEREGRPNDRYKHRVVLSKSFGIKHYKGPRRNADVIGDAKVQIPFQVKGRCCFWIDASSSRGDSVEGLPKQNPRRSAFGNYIFNVNACDPTEKIGGGIHIDQITGNIGGRPG